MTIIAAADGSALGNPGPAGWAWYVDQDNWAAGGWDHGTNNMGELQAVLELFRATEHLPEEELKILCDSQYAINCISKWMPGWKKKGWKKADGKPVLNQDILKELDQAIAGRKYTFEWVKGHAGHDLNEAADDRARDAATAYQAKREPNRGPGFPGSGQSAASPAATPAARPGPAQELPEALFGDPGQPDLFSMLEDEPDPSFANPREASLESVVDLERELLDPAVRADPLRAAELMHPDFQEIGSSGRLWSRQDILEMLADDEAPSVELEVLGLARLDAATALLTYRSASARGSSLRSSVWQHNDGQWRLRFHQGTREG